MTATATFANPRRLREYETIYILEPNIDPDEADRVATRFKDVIAARSGKLLKIDNWGKRKLAYPIRKSSRGVFVFVKYLGFEDIVAEVERNLRLLDSVVRYQTVVMKGDVQPETYQIDPADLEFRRLEVTEEAEEELGIAQRLGLVDMPRPPRPEGGYEYGMEDEYGGGGLDEGGYAAEDEEEALMSYGQYKDDDMKNGRGGSGGPGMGGAPGENDPFGLRRRSGKRKICRFCADSELAIDYKDANQLKYFISDRGKIVPRRISGNCALHQRAVTTAIKRARNIALMPYTSGG